jgi:protease I
MGQTHRARDDAKSDSRQRKGQAMTIAQNLENRTVAILATNGFEQSELTEPRDQLVKAGATVHIVSPGEEKIRGWDGDDWGDEVEVDVALAEADPGDYDALVLPGGQINPDLLRVNEDALAFIEAFDADAKPLAAICHAPWLLIETGIADGRRMTCYQSIRTDLENAGADVVDEEAVVDGHLITSRNPGDLDAFCREIGAMLAKVSEEA